MLKITTVQSLTRLPQGEGSDAASFEKALSALAAKIQKSQDRDAALRKNARRFKVALTLYGGFAYILTALILVLVTGWQNWGAVEYTVIAGGPVLLYLGRLALTKYYDYRLSGSTAHLETLQKERDATIAKLKKATKYDSTQQLLDKYGSSRPATQKEAAPRKNDAQPPRRQTGNFAPPPTANIPRPQGPPSLPNTPQRPPVQQSTPLRQPTPASYGKPLPPPPPTQSAGADFAPNAFGREAQYAAGSGFGEHRWYDRIMDALLGEDETQPKHRLALICHQCRLVNGQAPPGTKTLEDVGRWRCGGCGAWNGKENEAKKLMEHARGLAEPAIPTSPTSAEGSRSPMKQDEHVDEQEHGEETHDVSMEDLQDAEDEVHSGDQAETVASDTADIDTPPAKSTRSKSKSTNK